MMSDSNTAAAAPGNQENGAPKDFIQLSAPIAATEQATKKTMIENDLLRKLWDELQQQRLISKPTNKKELITRPLHSDKLKELPDNIAKLTKILRNKTEKNDKDTELLQFLEPYKTNTQELANKLIQEMAGTSINREATYSFRLKNRRESSLSGKCTSVQNISGQVLSQVLAEKGYFVIIGPKQHNLFSKDDSQVTVYNRKGFKLDQKQAVDFLEALDTHTQAETHTCTKQDASASASAYNAASASAPAPAPA